MTLASTKKIFRKIREPQWPCCTFAAHLRCDSECQIGGRCHARAPSQRLNEMRHEFKTDTLRVWGNCSKGGQWVKLCEGSEGESHCEVEGEVALEVGANDGEVVVVFFFVSRIDGLHATVEAEDEIVEVESQAQAIADRYL